VPEVCGAACDREQAGIIYREAASMVRASPALSSYLEVIDSRKTIVHKASNSFYRVLSADAFRAEGLNIHCAAVRRAARPARSPAVGRLCWYGGAARDGRHCCCRSPRPASTSKSDLLGATHAYAERVHG
jgi:hypothetical protein